MIANYFLRYLVAARGFQPGDAWLKGVLEAVLCTREEEPARLLTARRVGQRETMDIPPAFHQWNSWVNPVVKPPGRRRPGTALFDSAQAAGSG